MRDHHWKVCYEEAQALGFNEARAEALADLAAQNGKVRYANFNPQQPRDEEGQWSEVGGLHVQTDSGGIIRKGGHVGLHGKHVSEVPGFMEQLKKEPAAPTPVPTPAVPATPPQATPVAPAPAAKPMKSPDELAKGLKQPQAQAAILPLEGKSVQEIMKIANPSGGPTWPNPNPLGYNTASFPPSVNGPSFTKAVTDAVAQQGASNPLARLNLQQLYGMVTKTQPMSYGDFQNALAKLDKDGAISLGSYTQNLGQFQQMTGANPDQLMPLNSGYRWYVGPYTGAARMQEDETPDRYMDGRAMRQHHGKSVEHAVARLEVLAEGEADEEEIARTVEGIARQFTKAELREVALAFGVHMTGTKGEVIERLIDKLSGE